MPYIRAVGIIIHDKKILLMHRQNDGRAYFVFPGGHKEAYETLEEATVREVLEETSVSVSIKKLLYHHIYDDGGERFYFLCRYLEGEVKLGGPEQEHATEKNQYDPRWIPLSALPNTLVYPLEIRDWILKDIENGFQDTPRKECVIFAHLRQTLDS